MQELREQRKQICCKYRELRDEELAGITSRYFRDNYDISSAKWGGEMSDDLRSAITLDDFKVTFTIDRYNNLSTKFNQQKIPVKYLKVFAEIIHTFYEGQDLYKYRPTQHFFICCYEHLDLTIEEVKELLDASNNFPKEKHSGGFQEWLIGRGRNLKHCHKGIENELRPA